MRYSLDRLWTSIFFHFDISSYTEGDVDTYNHFSPINLWNLEIGDLDRLAARYFTVNHNEGKFIKVIVWQLNNVNHAKYIENSIKYILSTLP